MADGAMELLQAWAGDRPGRTWSVEHTRNDLGQAVVVVRVKGEDGTKALGVSGDEERAAMKALGLLAIKAEQREWREG